MHVCKSFRAILTKALILIKSNTYYLYKTNRQTNKGKTMNEFEVVITNWESGNTEVEIVEEELIERLIAILGYRFEGLREKEWNSDTEVELESEEAWVRIFQK